MRRYACFMQAKLEFGFAEKRLQLTRAWRPLSGALP